MAIETIRVARLSVQGKTVAIFETVDVVRREQFVDDDGRTKTRIIGDRLGYVIRGNNGRLGLSDEDGFSFDESLDGTERVRNFPSRRPAQSARLASWP